MSVANLLVPSTKKDQNIYCDSLNTVDIVSSGNVNIIGDGDIGSTLYVDSVNNRVGINVPAPSNELNIHSFNNSLLGMTTDSLVSSITIENNTSDNNGFLIQRNNNACILDASDTNGFLSFRSEGNNICRVQSDALGDTMDMESGTKFNFDKGTVTQPSLITDPVTLNSQAGLITTVSSVLGTQSKTPFTLNNNFITSTSQILVGIGDYNGAGLPSVYVDSVSAGNCTITLVNSSTSAVFNAPVQISFLIL